MVQRAKRQSDIKGDKSTVIDVVQTEPESADIVGEGVPTGQHLSRDDSAKVLKAQRARANLMAIGLLCLCVLFFMITIVKIGLWG
jgi:hypothetical protein